MPNWDASFAYDQFVKHRALMEAAKGANEATTRLRAINTMLFEVLGWDQRDVDAETHVRAEGYADYVLRYGEVSIGVVEAKRDGETFVLTGAKYTAEPAGFALLSKESKAAREAILQAAGYAASLGAKYVAITNGHQYIITLAFVSGVPIEHRSVMVFESLDAIAGRFRPFFECLSPAGVRANALAGKLLESRRAPAPTKLSTSIQGYPKPADRNIIANEIGWVLSTVWDEANKNESDESFLRRCYVIPELSRGTLAQAKEIIDQRTKADAPNAATQVHAQSEAKHLVTIVRPEKPIIVLGRVGHGKSTFLSYLRLVEAKDQLANYVQIEIDFLDRPATASEVQRYVFHAVDQQLLSRHHLDIREAVFARAALDSELRRFRSSISGSRHAKGTPEQQLAEDDYVEEYQKDEHRYLTAAIRHLRRSRHKSVAVFFDNLDRQDEAIQVQALLQASALARDWEAMIFVCLRPGTFHRSVATGTLDAIAPRTIAITPPRPDILLRKRFELAKEVAAGDSARAGNLQAASFGRNIKASLPSAAMFFECCGNSFINNRGLTKVFEAVSNGDMRSLLRYVRDVLTSQHLNTKKILENIKAGGYLLAAHEAVRALLYGDYWHYDPNKSVFPNVFDIDHADGAEHFIRPLALHFLERQTDTSSSHGFVPTKDITQYLCQLGFGQDTAQVALAWLSRTKCVEDRLGESVFSSGQDQVRVTSLGRFVVSDLVGSFVYADAVVVDTPITDAATRASIKDETTIESRVARCRLFKKYLDACSAALRDADANAYWKGVSDALEADIRSVSASLGPRR